MRFEQLFGECKPIFGMVHLDNDSDKSVAAKIEAAQKEIEIYLANGVVPLIENNFAPVVVCERVLLWLSEHHSDAVYGVNTLGNYHRAFDLAKRHNIKIIQIDSVCGHLVPSADEIFAQELEELRAQTDVVVLGGVRFKELPVHSTRSVAEDLLLAQSRCDAVVCAGMREGDNSPFDKFNEFRTVLGNFPLILGSGVNFDNATEASSLADGLIIGSSFKDTLKHTGALSKRNVKKMVSIVRNSCLNTK